MDELGLLLVVNEQEYANIAEQTELHGLFEQSLLALAVGNLFRSNYNQLNLLDVIVPT